MGFLADHITGTIAGLCQAVMRSIGWLRLVQRETKKTSPAGAPRNTVFTPKVKETITGSTL